MKAFLLAREGEHEVVVFSILQRGYVTLGTGCAARQHKSHRDWVLHILQRVRILKVRAPVNTCEV